MGSTPERSVGRRIRIFGTVQGVGFRPTVWRLAHDEGLAGHVLNDGAGVRIDAFGMPDALDRFCARLQTEKPPLARIERIDMQDLASPGKADGFNILESAASAITTAVAADAATCPDCLSEVLSSDDRRYGYAFANCTHCGPRLSIIQGIPYDRSSTTMRTFAMCDACRHEYESPADRRYHAQPIACPVCGPEVWLEEAGGGEARSGDAIRRAAALLRAGLILAVKGLGGFQLACDATNEEAVARLRRRKKRWKKPLAIMVPVLEDARRFAEIGEDEERLLRAPAAPIVLLEGREPHDLAPSISPGLLDLGVMLPYTPLHHLLLRAFGGPLVMTSANASEEPQCIANDEARQSLAGIADAFLMHDRDIANRVDDSVASISSGKPMIVRRARGFAPEPVFLPPEFAAAPPILAMGGELKSTFCGLNEARATLSQHLGDLDNPRTQREYAATLDLYRSLFRFDPAIVAVDLHPNYHASLLGRDLARAGGHRLVEVQHHHAHFAAVLAENGVALDDDESLGIILDGTGYGQDGTIWGGEILIGGYCRMKRVGRLAPVALLGGEKAATEPWRMVVSHLRSALGREKDDWSRAELALPWLRNLPMAVLDRMIERNVNSPMTTSAGRLFDAVAGVLDICREKQTYEGEAAIKLEALARPAVRKSSSAAYPVRISGDDLLTIEVEQMWRALIGEVQAGVPNEEIAARFHMFLAASFCEAAARLATTTRVKRIALSGGVVQNRLLLNAITRDLGQRGVAVILPRSVPANDGGLALGQAAVAAARVMTGI